MTIGDLMDVVEEKLKTGEINRLDNAFIGDDENRYALQDVCKVNYSEVVLVSNDLTEDLELE